MFIVVTNSTELTGRFEMAFSREVPVVRESVREFVWRLECSDIDGVTAVAFDARDRHAGDGSDVEEAIDELVRHRRYTYVFAVVSPGEIARAGDLAHRGVDRCFSDACTAIEIREALLETFSRFRTMCSTIRDVPELTDVLVGRSTVMQALRDRIRRVARTDDPVLILGETGVGKELIAHGIHRLSSRRDGPWTAVNVTTLVDTLFESEMYGVRRGAYTGAVESEGVLGASDGGTVFLDEIGDLPIASQPKLLRAIETGAFRRVGEAVDRSVSVRIITATNRDLPLHVDMGGFRRDLWHRIAGVYIKAPPLRDHIEDVEEIAYHILETRGRGDVRLTPGVVRWFHRYTWPGNVRELATVIGRALVNTDGSRIRVEHIEIDEVSGTRRRKKRNLRPIGARGYRTRGSPEQGDLPGLLPD
ncbi:MAG: sigma 54-interacting transcriptional regulator [Alkalispirochaeta sp.]